MSSLGAFLLQQCLDSTDPGTPLLPTSDHPRPLFYSFPVATFRTISAPFRELNSLLPATMSSLVHQLLSTEVEAPSAAWSPHTCRPLSGLLFPPTVWPGAGRGDAREDAKPAWRPYPLPGPAEPAETSAVKLRAPWKPPWPPSSP